MHYTNENERKIWFQYLILAIKLVRTCVYGKLWKIHSFHCFLVFLMTLKEIQRDFNDLYMLQIL